MANGGSSLVLVLDRTPFYGEAGGQVGDTGTIRGDRFTFEVADTKKENDFTLHVGQVTEGVVTVNDAVLGTRSTPTAARRSAAPTPRRTSCTTPCTTILGKHAQQAGSKVEPDRLRFDFANPEAVGRDRLRAIEEAVNERVLQAAPVTLDADADRAGQGSGRDGPLRREVSGHRPRGPDGRLLARALRRHAPRQRRPGRAVQDHRRGVGRRRHPADHRAGRQGRARVRAPGGRDPRRARRARSASRPPRSASESAACSRRSRRSRSRQPSGGRRPVAAVSADDLLAAARPGRRRDRRDPGRRECDAPTRCAS